MREMRTKSIIMPVEPSELEKRFVARNSRDELHRLIDGAESDQELRELIIRLVLRCAVDKSHFGCPFRILAGLSYASMTSMVNTLPRATCLSLFEMERDCRAAHDAECPATKELTE